MRVCQSACLAPTQDPRTAVIARPRAREGARAGRWRAGRPRYRRAASWITRRTAIDFALFHSPPSPCLCASCVIAVAKIFTLPLPFCTVPAFAPDGLQFAISHPIPYMSILVATLRQPAVLPSVSSSPSVKACSHELGSACPLARIAAVPFAGPNRPSSRRRAAAGGRATFQSWNLLKHAPDPAAFASLHSAEVPEVPEAPAPRGKTRRASDEKERSHSVAAA